MYSIRYVLISVFIGFLYASSVHAKETLFLGSSYYEPITTAKKDGVLDLVYQELSRRLNMTISIDSLENAERVLLNANSGLSDGDVGRVAGLEKRYPHLISIPVSIYHYEMIVLSKNVNFKVAGQESIMPYNIGLLRGWKILENLSIGAHSVTSLEEAEQVFTMLDKGRIDIALFEKSQAMPILKKMGLKDIKVLKPNLVEGDWYLYLNKKHKNLIPKITTELQKMHKDGTMKRISEKVQQKYAH